MPVRTSPEDLTMDGRQTAGPRQYCHGTGCDGTAGLAEHGASRVREQSSGTVPAAQDWVGSQQTADPGPDAVADRYAALRRRFLGRLSHELRTPLNAIIGLSEILEEEAEEHGHAFTMDCAARIRRAGTQQLMLVEALLELTEFENGAVSLHPTRFSVTDLLEEVAQTAKMADVNNNTLEIAPLPQGRDMQGDREKIRRVVLSLLGNAFKFTSAGRVTVGARFDPCPLSGERLVIAVSDTGPGIDPGIADRMFEDFCQGDETESRAFGGTGIGLALASRYVGLMGGELSVNSRPGNGATFELRLPRLPLDEGGES